MRTNGLFALLTLAFIALRLGTLLTCVECVSQHEYEELYQGTIAKELLEGLKVPLWNYQANHYNGGTLLVGLLAAPLFLLFGPSLFVLKLVPFFFSLATLLLTFFFFKRFFDGKTALLVCSLLVFSPPAVTALSLTTSNPHTESVFFSVAMLTCFYSFLYGEKNRVVFLILFGLVGGLGFWFTPLTFITLLSCLASWFLLDRRSFLSRQMVIFLGSLAIGLLPLIPYQLTHEKGILHFLGGAFLWVKGGTFLGKLQSLPIRVVTLAFENLPFIFYFRPIWIFSGKLLAGLYGLLIFSLSAPFLWQEGKKLFFEKSRSTRSVPLFLYPFFFIPIYALSNYPVFNFPIFKQFAELRYFSPLHYFVFFLLALALRDAKRPALLLCLPLGLGLLGQGSLLLQEPVGRALRYQGYSYLELGRTWGYFSPLTPFPQGLSEFQHIADQYPEPERRFLYWGLATVMDKKLNPHALWDGKRIVEAIHRVPSPYRPYFFASWGGSLCQRTEHNLDHWSSALHFRRKVAELAKVLPHDALPHFYYGLLTKIPVEFLPEEEMGNCLGYMEEQDFPQPKLFYFHLGRSLYFSLEPGKQNEASIELLNSLEEGERVWVCRGLGAMAGAYSSMFINLRGFNPLWWEPPSEDRREFYWGIGWGVREQMVEDQIRALDLLRRLPEEVQQAAEEGFQAFERWTAIAPGKGPPNIWIEK